MRQSPEVRRCLHCLVPLPIGRVIRGLCSACIAYRTRTGHDRPTDRERSLEAVSIIAMDVVTGTASVHELAVAVEALAGENRRYVDERHMTKMRAARGAGVLRNTRWVVRTV